MGPAMLGRILLFGTVFVFPGFVGAVGGEYFDSNTAGAWIASGTVFTICTIISMLGRKT